MAQAPVIKKILYITMSNLGDALMALPTFDFLRNAYPSAAITVVAGPRTRCIFENHPDVNKLIVFDKHSSLRDKIGLFFALKKQQFDVIVDLRDTFYRWGLSARHKNPAWIRFPSWITHESQKYLFKAVIASKGKGISEEEFLELGVRRNPSFISAQDYADIVAFLEKHHVAGDEDFILIFPGARSELKKWSKENYIRLLVELKKKYGIKVILAGTKDDQNLVGEIIRESGEEAIDASGRTNFGQLCALVLRSKLVICNDSGAMHIASYLNRPVVGIYGPTDYKKYGPWSKRALVVRRDVLCAPCGKASCRADRQCIKTIAPYDVMLAVRLILESDELEVKENKYRRILVVRTDRIGDVLLSTPVLKSLRDHYPASFIAMMVTPYTKDLVEGNPYLDQVIVFDKDRKHSGLFSTLAFCNQLKKERFDVAIILHPTTRVHLVCFLAGIRERIGYDWRSPYFLTNVIRHTKQEGLRHEVEYNFDLLRPLGISRVERGLTMPIKESSERLVENVLKEKGIGLQDKIIAVNPSSSCISRRWPLRKFAEVIDQLAALGHFKIAIIGGSDHRPIAEALMKLTRSAPIDLSGRFDLSQLASFFKRCALVISNDSGPVHLAVAVGTPVIAIFGRNQPGLSPRRWGPLGAFDVIVHKKTECAPCLAHDCTQNFRCLEAISVEEILNHASRILNVESAARIT